MDLEVVFISGSRFAMSDHLHDKLPYSLGKTKVVRVFEIPKDNPKLPCSTAMLCQEQ
jgi:hypothetical protein